MLAGFVVLGLLADAPPRQLQAASERLRRHCGWRRVAAQPDLEVWTSGAVLPVTHLAGVGLALGQLHWRGERLKPGQAVEATARDLVSTAWGGYLALLNDASGWHALRDPSGALDCVAWRREGLWCLASGLQDLPKEIWPARLSLDWDALSLGMAYSAAINWRSPLHDLTTITPGDLVALNAGEMGVAQVIWRPGHFASSPDDSRDAEAGLLYAVELAVGAAAGDTRRAIVEVSGGLDSAIVAGTLGRLGLADRVVAALHLQGHRPEGNELGWAAAVADRQAWLTVAPTLSPSVLDLEDFAALSRDVRPSVNAMDTLRDKLTLRVVRDFAAEVLVTGKGGDAVFFQPPTADILSDLVLQDGLKALTGSLARGLSRRLRRSLFSVGREALARRERRAPPSMIAPLLGPRGRSAAGASFHPWMQGLADLPPGKQRQIQGLVATLNVRGATTYGAAVEVRHPLLSQPVLEAALALPTWRLAEDGRERGLARRLFADRAPDCVLRRRSKGELGAYFAQTIARSSEALRPFLLDGVLCEAKVLDRVAVETALAPDTLIRRSEAPTLLRAVVIESWARHWQTQIPDWPADARRRPR